jgi:hypothetical protein
VKATGDLVAYVLKSTRVSMHMIYLVQEITDYASVTDSAFVGEFQ